MVVTLDAADIKTALVKLAADHAGKEVLNGNGAQVTFDIAACEGGPTVQGATITFQHRINRVV